MSTGHGVKGHGGPANPDANEPFVPGEGDPEPLATVTTLIVGAALVLITVIGLQALFYKTRDEELARKAGSVGTQEVLNLRAAQREKLAGYRWVDKANGVAAIPIERAMEQVEAESRADSLRGGGTN